MEATVHNRFFYFGKWRKDTVLICQSIFHDSSSAGVDSSVEPCRLFKGSFLTSDSVMPDLPAANMSPATLCPPRPVCTPPNCSTIWFLQAARVRRVNKYQSG